jgi:hypothetical protein
LTSPALNFDSDFASRFALRFAFAVTFQVERAVLDVTTLSQVQGAVKDPILAGKSCVRVHSAARLIPQVQSKSPKPDASLGFRSTVSKCSQSASGRARSLSVTVILIPCSESCPTSPFPRSPQHSSASNLRLCTSTSSFSEPLQWIVDEWYGDGLISRSVQEG